MWPHVMDHLKTFHPFFSSNLAPDRPDGHQSDGPTWGKRTEGQTANYGLTDGQAGKIQVTDGQASFS